MKTESSMPKMLRGENFMTEWENKKNNYERN